MLVEAIIVCKLLLGIIIIMLCHQHGYPLPSLATSPYRSSPLAGLRGYILYPHRAAVCMFELVVLLLLGHMWGSIEVHHLWARPCLVRLTISVTWSTTKRREIRNFPYPSMFELTGRQKLTVKRGIRNVGQFLAAEVTNPGQDESLQMFALCDRMDKERNILDRYSSPNESPDRVKEEERG